MLVYVVGQVSDPAKGIYGAGAHSDFGFLTLLATDNVSGLQVCKSDIRPFCYCLLWGNFI